MKAKHNAAGMPNPLVLPPNRNPTKGIEPSGFYGHLVIGKQGRKDKQTKHAVDDGRHCRQ